MNKMFTKDHSIDFKSDYVVPRDNHLEKDDLMTAFEMSHLVRICEQKLAQEREKGFIKGPVHLSLGQEIIPAAVSLQLSKSDSVFGAHRSHGHILCLGVDLSNFFAEFIGKKRGVSGGMGGSMHLSDPANGFLGAVPIVAGTVPIAAGAALAHKFDGSKNIAVVYLGDGAVEEGVVHETFNFASKFSLPILFVIENNGYASHMHLSERQPSQIMARFGSAHSIFSQAINGTHPVEAISASKAVVDYIRSNKAPAILEVITFRWLGHVDWRKDVDVGVGRSVDEIERWEKKDAILALENILLTNFGVSKSDIMVLKKTLQERVDNAWDEAVNMESVLAEDVLNNVLCNREL